MASLQNLQDLFVQEIKDLYSAEKQIEQALPKMAQTASSQDLRQAFELHLNQTRGQINRLEKISSSLGFDLAGKKCRGMEGIIEEGQEILEMKGDERAIDAGLIGAAQHVEHYEIAGYGCARTYARMLGHTEAERLLSETLREEEETDQKLTRIAEGHVNRDAQR